MGPTAPITTTTTSTTSVPVPTTPFTSKKWVVNLSTTPYPSAGSPLRQGTKHCNSSQVPTQGNLHCSCGGGMYQTSPREAEALRPESSQLLKKNCPVPKPSITLEEQKAIRELNEDSSWVILTAAKGVVMDRNTTQTRPNYYWQTPILTSPSPKILPTNSKINFPKYSGTSKTGMDSMTSFTGKCTPPVQLCLNCMAYPKYIKLASPQAHCLQ